MPFPVQEDDGTSESASVLAVGSSDKVSAVMMVSRISFLFLNLFLRRFHAVASLVFVDFDFALAADDDCLDRDPANFAYLKDLDLEDFVDLVFEDLDFEDFVDLDFESVISIVLLTFPSLISQVPLVVVL